MSFMMVVLSLVLMMALLFGAVSVVFSFLMRRERDRAAQSDPELDELEISERLAVAQHRRFVPHAATEA